MIYFFLFGQFGDAPHLVLDNDKLLEKMKLHNAFDPNVVFGMANSLYQISSELEVGDLKELDLKTYSILTRFHNNSILAIGVDKRKKNIKEIDQLKELSFVIHQAFQEIPQPVNLTPHTLDSLLTSLTNIFASHPSLRRALKAFAFHT